MSAFDLAKDLECGLGKDHGYHFGNPPSCRHSCHLPEPVVIARQCFVYRSILGRHRLIAA